MDVKKYIDDFLYIIKDPRNITPHEFSKYFPKPGEEGNPKNLSCDEIEKNYNNLWRFKINNSYRGHVSLKSQLYLILDSFKHLESNKKRILFTYYVLKSKEEMEINLSYLKEDKILSKQQYFSLLGTYTLFYYNIKKILLEQFQLYLDEESNISTNLENPYPRVFSSLKSYNLWMHLTKYDKRYAYRSYMYRSMFKDGFILVGDAEFRYWLVEKMDDEPLDKTKPLPNYHTKEKENIYFNAKQLIFKGE